MLQITAIGNLGSDPDMRYTPGGKSVTSFRLACRTGKDATTWVTAVLWGPLGETAHQHLSKGDKVAVVGRLQLRDFTRQDGSRGTVVEVVGDNLEFVTTKPKGEPVPASPAVAAAVADVVAEAQAVAAGASEERK